MIRIASGELADVAVQAKEVFDREGREPVWIFDDTTSERVEIDFRGSVSDVAQRVGMPPCERTSPVADVPRGPGRPRLGVVAREVTLLPRHWEWLNSQPGGASVALRKLVEEARRVNKERDRVRCAQESTYRFMSAMAGNLPGFEEALRALFGGNHGRFEGLIEPWPSDVRDHIRRLSSAAFPAEETGVQVSG